MRIPLFAPAFNTADSARTTLSASPYCKKFAAVNQNSKFELFGLPNVCNSCSSELMAVIELTGPFSKGPAIAPIDVDTAGTTFVRSISLT